MEVDLGGPFYGAVGEQRLQWLGGPLQSVVQHGLVGCSEHQGVLKQHSQRVDVDVEGQHYAPGKEGVGLSMVPGEKRKPHFHSCFSTGQPQGFQQVTLLLV